MFSKKKNILAIKLLAYTNLWVAMCFACFTVVMLEHMNLELKGFWSFAMGSVLFLYNYTRQITKGAPVRKDAQNYHALQGYFRWIINLLMVAGCAYAVFYAFRILNWKILVTMLPVGILGLTYVLPNGGGVRWLPGFKMYAIAGAWSYFATVLPWVLAGKEWGWMLFLFFLSAFLVVLALCIPFDIRDAEADDPSLKTLPGIIGWRASRYVATFLMMAGLLLLSSLNMVFVGVNLVFVVIYSLLLFAASPYRSSLYFDFLMEGLPVIWLLLLSILV